jgi:hypothetical protein
MTDNPVAAANDRTMWKRETPPIAATSSSVSGSARWLSINQSAFWAGFINDGLRSKHAHGDRFARPAFDSPCAHAGGTWQRKWQASAALRKMPAQKFLRQIPAQIATNA